MIRRCLRTITKLGLRLGVATGIGFAIYRLIESRRDQSRTDSDAAGEIPLIRPATTPSPAAQGGSPASAPPPRSISSEPVTPDPPLVEPEMLTSVKGLRSREPIAGVGFGSGAEQNGAAGGAAGATASAGRTKAGPTGPAKKAPAARKAGSAKRPSAGVDKPPSKPKGTTGDTGPKMPPARKPKKSQE